MPATMNVTVYRGPAKTLRFMVQDAAGNVVNVAGWTTRFTARTIPSAPDPPAIGPLPGVVLGDGSLGEIDVLLSSAQTLALATQQYTYSFERIDSGFEDLLSIATMTVKYDILHPA